MTLKYLTSTKNSAGVTYFYLRRNGKKTPLGQGPIDSPEFLARYAEAMGATGGAVKSVKENSLAALCNAFRAGTTYKTKSKGYRAVLDRNLAAITEAYGEAPIAGLKPHHIRADLNKLDPHPANARLKTWRLLCTFANDSNWSPINATDGIKRGALPKSDGHTPWSSQDIADFRARWNIGSVQRLAMELLFWTGARTVDAVRLSPSMVGADGVLTFTQSKTGGKAYVPWTCHLPAWASGFEADRQHLLSCLQAGTFTYLETSSGKVRSEAGLSNLISAATRPGISAHGLRKSRLTAIAEAGGSASAIMSWGGHKSLKEAEDYVSTANRKALLIGTEQKQKSANKSDKSANKHSKKLK
ncbi:site-specific integrase [Arenibacterium halophilum]|uniref:site-specific integrase n=1 Tax=Arenibacterium halophilum TaxID=2583821 RepID=UPI0014874C4D|nr:tyrosine-type recombinase/integrase [Arenibacterium halophilum]